MPTTREKITALVDELRATPVNELDGDGRQIAELLQISAGLGFDPLEAIVPATDGEADVLIDKLICLGLALRGDDLPPFDVERYGEALEADG